MLTVESDLLKTLAAHRGDPSISVYIPTHTRGSEIEQDHIRLKNALSTIETALSDAGHREDRRSRLLEPMRARIEDREFWRHQGSGLAMFRSDDRYHEVRLPADVRERARVEDRFYITPLVAAVGEFSVHLLALSRSDARLFEMGRHGVSTVELPPDTPRSLEDANWFVDREAQLQDRSHNTGGEFHGHSDTGSEKADLRRFLRELSEGVRRVVGDSPVVVAAVNELAAAYRNEAHHHVSDEVVTGNPDGLDAHQLRERADAVVERLRSRSLASVAESWSDAVGTGQGTRGIIDTLVAANHGRVATLLIGDTSPIWGTFDPAESEVVVFDDRGSDHRNLLDDAIRQTLAHGGDLVRTDEIDSDIGALLRY